MKPGKFVRKINCIDPNLDSPSPVSYSVKSDFEEHKKGFLFGSKNIPKNEEKHNVKEVPGPGAYANEKSSLEKKNSHSFSKVNKYIT